MDRRIYYGIDGERRGPVSLDEIRQMLQEGQLKPTDFLWDEVNERWIAIAEYPGLAQNVSAFGPTEAPPFEPERIEYAGFWLRFGGHILDTLILIIPTFVWVMIASVSTMVREVGLEGMEQLDPAEVEAILMGTDFMRVYYTGALILYWLYFAGMEASPWQATIGKKVMGIRVINAEGYACRFSQTSLRFIVKLAIPGAVQAAYLNDMIPMFLAFFLTLIIMGGFISAAFHPHKRAVHDRIVGTFCERI